jgi:hypothetical protein
VVEGEGLVVIDVTADYGEMAALVAPWLPDARVEDLDIQLDCNCYSEWTQEPPRFYITFEAPWSKSEKELSKVVAVLDSLIRGWVISKYTFTGCSNCGGEPSLWVRVIPLRKG